MCDRECRDLIRGIKKKSPKKNIEENNKGYKLLHERLEDNEDSENKSIIAQDPNFLGNTTDSKLPFKCDTKRSLFHDQGRSSSAKDTQFSNNSLKQLLMSSNSAFRASQTEEQHVHQSHVQNNKEKVDTNHCVEEPWHKGTTEYHNNQFHTTHPVYRTISLINGNINRMDLNQMKNRCKELQLDSNGKREAVKRRLKEYYKTEKLIEAGLLERRSSDERNSDFFVVVGTNINIT